MTRLDGVLSSAVLPLAELCAARMDGELYRIDECFSPVDAIETPQSRAAAVRAIAPDRVVAERFTAAWIRGATIDAPRIHTFCTRTTARVRTLSLRAVVREVVIDDRDIEMIAGMPVTTALRTALDIARHSQRFTGDTALVVRRLLALGNHTLDECVHEFARRPNLPGKRRATVRLQIALDLPADHQRTIGARPSRN